MSFVWSNPDTKNRYWIEIMSSGPENVWADSAFWHTGNINGGASFHGGSVVINSSIRFRNQPVYGVLYKQGEFFKPFEVVFRFFPIENYKDGLNWIDMDIPLGETRPVMILANEGKIFRVYEDKGYDGPYEDWPDKPY